MKIKPYYTTENKTIYLSPVDGSREILVDVADIKSFTPFPDCCGVNTSQGSWLVFNRLSGPNNVTFDNGKIIKDVRYMGIDQLIDSAGLV